MKILIADDEAMSRGLLQSMLERAGYEVIAVENGRQAEGQICTADGPRLALLDWIMPELDGPGVCREVRKRKEHSTFTWCFSHLKKQKKMSLRAWSLGQTTT